jgi:hypothetical protein
MYFLFFHNSVSSRIVLRVVYYVALSSSAASVYVLCSGEIKFYTDQREPVKFSYCCFFIFRIWLSKLLVFNYCISIVLWKSNNYMYFTINKIIIFYLITKSILLQFQILGSFLCTVMLRKFVIVKPGHNTQCHIFCNWNGGYHSFCLGLGSLNIESHFVKFFSLKIGNLLRYCLLAWELFFLDLSL